MCPKLADGMVDSVEPDPDCFFEISVPKKKIFMVYFIDGVLTVNM